MMTMTFEALRDLLRASRSKGDKKEIFELSSKCHPEGGIKVGLDCTSGRIAIACRECGDHMVTLQLERTKKNGRRR